MQSLDKIKRRIKSIQTTSKITGAMRLVATAKLKKQMNEFKTVSEFCKDFYGIIEDIARTIPNDKNVNKSKSKLWILITSSLGLCGSFNINVCKYLTTLLKPEDKIIVIGQKGSAYLKAHNFQDQIIETVQVSDSNLNYFEILPLTETIINTFFQNKINSVHIVYSKFINSLTFQPTDLQVLPLDFSLFKSNKENEKHETLDLDPNKKEILYEPNKQEIIRSSTPIYLTTSLFAAISESRVCENGARRNAMETATDNAKELIDNLTVQFNRARQEHITQEINEIVTGSNGG